MEALKALSICLLGLALAGAPARAEIAPDLESLPELERSPDSVGSNQGVPYLREASKLYRSGQYFNAARYAFGANEEDPALKSSSYAWIAMGLVHAGMPNAAAYFFIRTLQSGNRSAIHSVLTQSQELFMTVGPDLIRQYMVRHTKAEDYDPVNRNAYYYVLGKDALLRGNSEAAIGYFGGVSSESPFWAYALQLRATAYAIAGKRGDALRDFRQCAESYHHGLGYFSARNRRYRDLAVRESEDLRARCQAGESRILYEAGQFDEADRAYDHISKQSIIWTDILAEQAWNGFARGEYNRALGKLVSYKSPALQFVFNPEIDVLRAQSYLALCLYKDANDVVNEFNSSFKNVGESVKAFVEGNSDNLGAFYQKGKAALKVSMHSKDKFNQVLNRFIRGPYFQTLVAMEGQIQREQKRLSHLKEAQTGTGFPGFLAQVLGWRERTVTFLGGAFIKNSLMDYHASLLDDFDKMAFIKLEMLKRAKEELLDETMKVPHSGEERARGAKKPHARDDQYEWGFNGEFWADELGDYVFGLETACKK